MKPTPAVVEDAAAGGDHRGCAGPAGGRRPPPGRQTNGTLSVGAAGARAEMFPNPAARTRRPAGAVREAQAQPRRADRPVDALDLRSRPRVLEAPALSTRPMRRPVAASRTPGAASPSLGRRSSAPTLACSRPPPVHDGEAGRRRRAWRALRLTFPSTQPFPYHRLPTRPSPSDAGRSHRLLRLLPAVSSTGSRPVVIQRDSPAPQSRGRAIPSRRTSSQISKRPTSPSPASLCAAFRSARFMAGRASPWRAPGT